MPTKHGFSSFTVVYSTFSECEKYSSDVVAWKDSSEKSAAEFSSRRESLESNSRSALEEAKREQDEFFSQTLKRDAPTGETPARERTLARTYPKEIIEVRLVSCLALFRSLFSFAFLFRAPPTTSECAATARAAT